jgi:hypothetical protein
MAAGRLVRVDSGARQVLTGSREWSHAESISLLVFDLSAERPPRRAAERSGTTEDTNAFLRVMKDFTPEVRTPYDMMCADLLSSRTSPRDHHVRSHQS